MADLILDVSEQVDRPTPVSKPCLHRIEYHICASFPALNLL